MSTDGASKSPARAAFSPKHRPSGFLVKPALAENRAKGRCLIAIWDYVRSRRVDGFMHELSEVNQELAALTGSNGIVASGWYPIAWYRDTHKALRQATGSGYHVARELGRESVRHDLSRGIYKVFLKVVSPQFLLARAPALFARYIERGRIEILEIASTSACFKFLGCDGFDVAIFQDLLGGCEGGLLAAGAKNVVISSLQGGRDGDNFVCVRASWS